VTITRDKYDIPHVRSKTYDGGIWAAGWIVAEDRGLLLQFGRFNSRVAAVDVPGLKALDLISQTRSFVPSAQTEQIVARQTKVLEKAGKTGRQVLHDIDTFAKGVNAYFKASKSTQPKWTRNDTFALEALKGQFVGQGGGDEDRNSELFTGLASRLGDDAASKLYLDLRQQDDPDMPASIDGSFPYEPNGTSRAGNLPIDPGSLQNVNAVAGTRAVTSTPAGRPNALASNELMIDAKHSTTGRPLLVGGPQIGYFYPGLTYEIDMHAPGLVWRGATSAPFPGYMLIGRGPDFSTTLTSASGDIVDQYAETLCGDDFHYMYKGKCREMTVLDAGTLDGKTVSFHSTVHGPVIAYATSSGTRVAISRKRSSYGKDALDLLYNHDLSTGVVHDYKSFFKAASRSPQTFNSFYIDNKHIALFTSGLLPVRPTNLDPSLITNGNGDYEWKGFISANAHIHGIDPKDGTIVNWNNNAAKGFGAADDQWKRSGSEGRVDLLNKNLARLAKNGKWDLPAVTSAMNAAATQDVREVNTVPLLKRLLAGTTAPSAQAQQLFDLLVAWSKDGTGGSRLDLNLDGKVDDPGAGVMQAAWDKIADAVMAPALGPQLDFFAELEKRSDLSQYNGWYQYIDKDLHTLLGDPVTRPFNTKFCGGGVKATCQSVVWNALQDAVSAGTTTFGTSDPTQWFADAAADRIKFTPGAPSLTIRWTNRPSGIQQVISFKGHR
jgi:acyl-homoserine lactone acylase PvdQ